MVAMLRLIIRIILSCFAAFVGLILGAFVLYAIAGVLYRLIFPGPVTNSYECSRGMFFGWLSILLGGLLGACFGGYGAYKLFDEGHTSQV